MLYDQVLHRSLDHISEPCRSHSGVSLVDVTEFDQDLVAEMGANGVVVIELLGIYVGFRC